MRYLKYILLLFILSIGSSWGQSIYPGLSGAALLDKLVQDYKPSNVLGYNEARDKMYGLIDNHNDKVTCVYSGYQVDVPYNANRPRDYTNAATPIMNCEHTWPQSLGASGNAKSDMHHLFPTNGDVNGARASFPFAELDDDSETDKWFRFTETRTNKPASAIDEWSELNSNTSFEPPEAHKGNVARAMFYFYTMYKNQADDNFFKSQKEVWRMWNSMDPVDQAEIERTNAIAGYQGTVNPFVTDTTLIGRAYFGVTNLNENETVHISTFELQQNYPNPFNPTTTIAWSLTESGFVQLNVYNLAGQKVATLIDGDQYTPGAYQVNWDGGGQTSGIYLYQIRVGSQVETKKLMLLK